MSVVPLEDAEVGGAAELAEDLDVERVALHRPHELAELGQVEHVLLGTHLLDAVLELVQVDLVQGDSRRLQPAPVDHAAPAGACCRS